jgi:hypothetical protein
LKKLHPIEESLLDAHVDVDVDADADAWDFPVNL